MPQFTHILNIEDKDKRLPSLTRSLEQKEPPQKKRKTPQEIFEKFKEKKNIKKK